jgi:prepilin-type N-terminal cleavage/methylation domain-containing protein
MRKFNTCCRLWAVTLLELMVVVLIIGILASVATGVYTGQTERARVAATHALIRSLEVAITRYEMDTGSLPPSGSGSDVPPAAMSSSSTGGRLNGSGYLHLVLMHSINGSAVQPASASWKGPYINLQPGQLKSASTSTGTGASTPTGLIDITDPWGMPILYVAWPDYAINATDFWGGTQMSPSTAPAGANPNLPAPNPFAATETFYNPKTFQLISFGPSARSYDATSVLGTAPSAYTGTDADDINNFGY